MPRRGRGRGGRGRGERGTREQQQGGGYRTGGRRWQGGYNDVGRAGTYTGGGYPQFGSSGVRRQGYGRWSNEPPYQRGDFGETDVGFGPERQGGFAGDRYQGDYRGREYESGPDYGRDVGPEELRFPVTNREGGWGAGEGEYGGGSWSGNVSERDVEFGRAGRQTFEPGELAERNFERSFARGPYTGRGPRNYTRTDDRISEEVCELLTDAGELDASSIDVRIENGEVTLEGTVPDRRAKRMAEDIAEQARGVRDVHNRLRVASRESEQQRETP